MRHAHARPSRPDYPLQIIRRAWHWQRVSPGKIIAAQTKSALHRTRLQVLHHKNFSVLFFYKGHGQTAWLLAFCQVSPTEKYEKNFSTFQFPGSRMDLFCFSSY
ncbi:hypothetical protein [Pantoea sp. WMus005]|uniref:hypothetical protein n=1 Tax=Pantoea sp. WMus005 TaxID=2750734 RepID=UPI0015D01CFD|nr:hypothetical protein [Pantoea sp. WMus005]NYS31326.1 hypothetical protein [Pantoea sp. WMus005]